MRYSFLRSIKLLCLLLVLNGANAQYKDAAVVGKCMQALTDVMIHDISSPLIASRDYAYTMIAFYEAARFADPAYRSYAGQLNGLSALPQPEAGVKYDWQAAGMAAFHTVAAALVFSKDIFEDEWLKQTKDPDKKTRVEVAVRNRSEAFGNAIGQHVIEWAKADNYGHTRTLPRYTPSKAPGTWQQTAPDYMEAIEPYWNQIRPMVLTRPDQFEIPAPAAYKSPAFMEACKEVYNAKKNISKDQTWIANFWDCNPFATRTVGHLMYSIKKISPGGHWMGITRVAVTKAKQPLVPALAAYSMVSVALFDAFIACWDIKYKTNYIRPVTAIQTLMEPNWDPILQTPPFPEYPSGHSVISNASAVVLTELFGSNFGYVDNVEKPYGVENRSYKSFYDAAAEAAISRLYGGIHFREAIDNGASLGKKIGAYVFEKVKLKN